MVPTPADPAAGYLAQANARTAADGQFRIVSLPPGDYVVDVPLTQVTIPRSVAAGGRAGMAARLNDSFAPAMYLAGTQVGALMFQTMGPVGSVPLPRPPATGKVTVYPASMLSATPSAPYGLAHARIVTLLPGDVHRVEVRLTAVEGRRVSGKLTGDAAAVAHLGVRLLPEIDDRDLFRDGDFELAATATDATGAFTFLGVPPGRYTLKVLYVPSTMPSAAGRAAETPARTGLRGGGAPTPEALALVQWAETTVTVEDRDVAALSVPLHRAARVSGRIEFADPATAPPDFSSVSIGLLSNRPVTIAPPRPVPVSPDGTFTAFLYGPGRYRAAVSGLPGGGPAGFVMGNGEPTNWLTVPGEGVVENVRVVIASPLARGLTLALPSAPPPPPSPDNGFIAGRVIEGDTGGAIAGATIVLQQGGATGPRRVATSDASGSFTFGDAVAGSYGVTVTAPGYSTSGFGKLRADGPTRSLGLAPRERVGAILLRMWKPGRIGGRVVDDRGNAVGSIPLVSVQVSDAGGAREYVVGPVTRTTAMGAYQFSNLPAGRYVVCAVFTPTTFPAQVFETLRRETTTGRVGGPMWARLQESGAPIPAFTATTVGPWRLFMTNPDTSAVPVQLTVSSDGAVSAYSRSCSPAAAAFADATVLNVRAGDDLTGVEVRLTLASPARKVSGSLRGPGGPVPYTAVRLMHAGDNDQRVVRPRPDAAASVSDADGTFTLLGIAPGRYVLRAWSGHVEGQDPAAPILGRVGPRPNGLTSWAEMPLTVGSSDLSNVTVTLAPPPAVTGKLIFAGAGTPPLPSEYTLSLLARHPTDVPPPAPVPVAADGSFTFRGYAPGRYTLPQVNVSGWRITSATLDGKPLVGHEIDLGSIDTGNLVLSATNQFTQLQGMLEPQPGLAPVGVSVLVFPADYRQWIAHGMSPVQLRSGRLTGTWAFNATWLPPGDYLMVVYREAEGEDVTPAFIERIASRAEKVRLAEGQAVTIALTLAQLR